MSTNRRRSVWGWVLCTAKRLGLIASILACTLMLAHWCGLTFYTGMSAWGSFRGMADGSIDLPFPGPTLRRHVVIADGYDPHVWHFAWEPGLHMGQFDLTDGRLRLPTWFISTAAVATTILLWRLDRPPRTPNTCATCTYDLTGLPPTAPCPECGRAP